MTDLRFRVGLSFAGEYRPFVGKVAHELAMKWGKQQIFYDNFHEDKLAIFNLDTHLQKIYQKQCDLVVIFIGKDYEKKEWCRLEWRAIRELIKTKIQESPLAIMPIRMDSGDVPGLFSTDGYIDIRGRKPKEIASLINQRLASLGHDPHPPGSINQQPSVLDDAKEAQSFTEYLGNRVELEMVGIPGGTFMMGSAGERHNGEYPQHRVNIQPLSMGKFPVTQEQWKVVSTMPKVTQELKPSPSWFKGNKLPVEQITWHEAVEFCARLSKHSGKNYRLPSEAEWEYACRAGTDTQFFFGECLTPKLAKFDYNNQDYKFGEESEFTLKSLIQLSPEILILLVLRLGGTTPVGQFPDNAFGLYDMHGNVWEWCSDTGRTWIDNKNQNTRLLRGGSWSALPKDCRSAARCCNKPDGAQYDTGFRVVCGGAAARTFDFLALRILALCTLALCPLLLFLFALS
ncbi:SUMF1/EgtB/PvdO family nonheme iron enzyme [Nodularia spumigena]|uniref:SUMF1/EgtB/PvdO family nonheme iron enzyme n=1 Tax=Nodularia spumigena TaxID=70799 RepID=UPI0023310FA4|nr:SUMF1/EgtB/PvdO family nonheme iron enzyme [Nodularia spumigena]MDB9320062.1 SUMF1/EgtB/PvdO family nonheme iron enzyme [Nodularia spumigena CS-590/01A]MDB9327222.1 SUMF1/EgtB/PvdO family nonheme iron enzyme [Nodularia spumigena CS-590/02]MDB9336129.1 SUMF1/EgtB/PvdO family nonheme iron enzyme [Nodularia spumigena CS-590/01]